MAEKKTKTGSVAGIIIIVFVILCVILIIAELYKNVSVILNDENSFEATSDLLEGKEPGTEILSSKRISWFLCQSQMNNLYVCVWNKTT